MQDCTEHANWQKQKTKTQKDNPDMNRSFKSQLRLMLRLALIGCTFPLCALADNATPKAPDAPKADTATADGAKKFLVTNDIKDPFGTWYVAAGLTADLLNRSVGDYMATNIALMRNPSEPRILVRHIGREYKAANILAQCAWVKVAPAEKPLAIKCSFYQQDGIRMFDLTTEDYAILNDSTFHFGNQGVSVSAPVVGTLAQANEGKVIDPAADSKHVTNVVSDTSVTTSGDGWKVLPLTEDAVLPDGRHTTFLCLQRGENVRLFTNDNQEVTSAMFAPADYVLVTDSAIKDEFTIGAYKNGHRYFVDRKFKDVSFKAKIFGDTGAKFPSASATKK